MGAVVDFADFWPISESEVGARNGQERVECGPERPIQAAGEVRRRSQEPASVRGNRRDQTRKNPNRELRDPAKFGHPNPAKFGRTSPDQEGS